MAVVPITVTGLNLRAESHLINPLRIHQELSRRTLRPQCIDSAGWISFNSNLQWRCHYCISVVRLFDEKVRPPLVVRIQRETLLSRLLLRTLLMILLVTRVYR